MLIAHRMQRTGKLALAHATQAGFHRSTCRQIAPASRKVRRRYSMLCVAIVSGSGE